MRINLDARTQTAYGTLRAFVRLDAGARILPHERRVLRELRVVAHQLFKRRVA